MLKEGGSIQQAKHYCNDLRRKWHPWSNVKREQTTGSSKGGWYQCHNWYKGQPPDNAYTIAIGLNGSWTDPGDDWSCWWMGPWNRASRVSQVAKWKGWCHDSADLNCAPGIDIMLLAGCMRDCQQLYILPRQSHNRLHSRTAEVLYKVGQNKCRSQQWSICPNWCNVMPFPNDELCHQ